MRDSFPSSERTWITGEWLFVLFPNCARCNRLLQLRAMRDPFLSSWRMETIKRVLLSQDNSPQGVCKALGGPVGSLSAQRASVRLRLRSLLSST